MSLHLKLLLSLQNLSRTDIEWIIFMKDAHEED